MLRTLLPLLWTCAIALIGLQGCYAWTTDGKPLGSKDLGRLNTGAYDLPGYEPVTLTAQPGERSVREGVYTAAQAKRGEKTYQARCLPCHQVDYFTAPVFMQSWNGQTADALYDAIRTTMPTDNPGGLKPLEYADLLAYLFKMNRLPSGETELKGTKAALKQIRIERP